MTSQRTMSRHVPSPVEVIAPARSEPTAAVASRPGGAVSAAIRVLCVDDHAVLIEGLKAQFSIDGRIEVVGTLSSAEHLIDEAERLKPDVVLLDIEMPGPDAFETADRLKRVCPEVRVIVLSAHIRDAFITASYAAGARGYFAKSEELEDIVRGIYDTVQGRSGSFILGPKVRERCRPVLAAGESTAYQHAGTNQARSETSGPKTLLSSLTAREVEILRMIGKGLSRTQIAEQLCRSVKTVDGHQERIIKKLGIKSRADLMRFSIREGLAEV